MPIVRATNPNVVRNRKVIMSANSFTCRYVYLHYETSENICVSILTIHF